MLCLSARPHRSSAAWAAGRAGLRTGPGTRRTRARPEGGGGHRERNCDGASRTSPYPLDRERPPGGSNGEGQRTVSRTARPRRSAGVSSHRRATIRDAPSPHCNSKALRHCRHLRPEGVRRPQRKPAATKRSGDISARGPTRLSAAGHEQDLVASSVFRDDDLPTVSAAPGEFLERAPCGARGPHLRPFAGRRNRRPDASLPHPPQRWPMDGSPD